MLACLYIPHIPLQQSNYLREFPQDHNRSPALEHRYGRFHGMLGPHSILHMCTHHFRSLLKKDESIQSIYFWCQPRCQWIDYLCLSLISSYSPYGQSPALTWCIARKFHTSCDVTPSNAAGAPRSTLHWSATRVGWVSARLCIVVTAFVPVEGVIVAACVTALLVSCAVGRCITLTNLILDSILLRNYGSNHCKKRLLNFLPWLN